MKPITIQEVRDSVNKFEIDLKRIYNDRIKKLQTKTKPTKHSEHSNKTSNKDKDEFDAQAQIKRLQNELQSRECEIRILRARLPTVISALVQIDEYRDIISQNLYYSPSHLSLFNGIAYTSHYAGIFLPLLPKFFDQAKLDHYKQVFNKLLSPPKIDQAYLDDNFVWLENLQVFSEGKVRYIPNISYRSLCKVIDETELIIKATASTDTNNNDYNFRRIKRINDNGKMLKSLFKKNAGQQRFGTIQKNTLSMFYVKQRLCESEYYVNLPDDDEVNCPKSLIKKTANNFESYLALMAIVRHYNGLPFYGKRMSETSSEDILVKKDEDCSLVLPIVCIALLNGTLAELLGDLNDKTAEIYIDNISNSLLDHSLVQGQLALRKHLRPLSSLVYDQFRVMPYVTRSEDGHASKVTLVRTDGEFFESEQARSKMYSVLETYPNIKMVEYIKHCLSRAEHYNRLMEQKYLELMGNDRFIGIDVKTCDLSIAFKTLEWLRRVTMLFNTLTNFGIYNKTSLILDYRKSTGTKFVTPITRPAPAKTLITNDSRLTFTYHWQRSKFSHLYEYFNMNWKHTIVAKFNKEKSFERFFVLNLTNRSGGDKHVDPNLPESLQNISNARIISFLINNAKYYDTAKFLELLNAAGKCWVRHQIDRRGRIIVIVPNAIQTSDIFLLHAFNTIKNNERLGSAMAVGKQVGNILDANKQLIASGNHMDLKNSSDMSGMDAHTIPVITCFLRYLMIECLQMLDRDRSEGYFTGHRGESVMITEGLLRTETLEYVHPESVHVARVLQSMLPKNLILKSDINSTVLNNSDQTFMSGLFATSGQHTMFLVLLISALIQKNQLSLGNIIVDNYVMGDDIFQNIKNGVVHDDQARVWINLMKSELESFNYEIDGNYSKYSAQFLQQVALNGVYVPLPMRVGVFCDEKSQTLFRNPVDVIKVVTDITLTRAQRSYAIDNAMCLGPVFWNSIRVNKMKARKNQILSLVRTMTRVDLLNHDIITPISDDSFLIMYPYFCLHTNPINWPMFGIVTTRLGSDDTVINEFNLPQSMTVLGGSCSRSHINHIFATNRYPMGIDIKKHKPLPDCSTYIDWSARNSFGFTIAEHFNAFHRIRKLSAVRLEEVGGSVEQMASSLKMYSNQTKLSASYASYQTLLNSGIHVPDRLCYFNAAKTKINQALESRLESLDEQIAIDLSYYTYINNYTVIPTGEVMREHELSCVTLDPQIFRIKTDEEIENTEFIEMSIDKLINAKIPILPGYHINSDYGKLYLYMGRPIVNDDERVLIGHITSMLSASFDIDSAVDFGIRIYNTQPNKLADVAITMGIEPDKTILFENLVKKWSAYGYRTKYSSIFKPSLYFAISGDLDVAFSYLNETTFTTRRTSRKLTPILRAWARDMLFMYIRHLPLTKFSILSTDFCLKEALGTKRLHYSEMALNNHFKTLLSYVIPK